MTDQTTNPEAPDVSAAQTDTADGEMDWKKEAEKWKSLARKHEAAAKANAEAARRLKEAEELEKSETQKLLEQLEAEKQQASKLQAELMRLRVALTKGLPAELASRLQGETEEELAEDADRLMALLNPPASTVPRASSRQGSTSAGPADDPLLRDLKLKLGIP